MVKLFKFGVYGIILKRLYHINRVLVPLSVLIYLAGMAILPIIVSYTVFHYLYWNIQEYLITQEEIDDVTFKREDI